ncbi:MAG: glycoside hydrolase family 30 beta sandwich domain-containing protein [Pseudomonadota bacterium]
MDRLPWIAVPARRTFALSAFCLWCCVACTEQAPSSAPMATESRSTVEILVTSEAGDRLASKENATLSPGQAPQEGGARIEVFPDQEKQTMTGVGSSFTESSAFVLAHLPPEERAAVMREVYGEDGANLSIARTVIASTDFSVEGRYTYAPVADDAALEHFSIEVDTDGFDPERYPGIADETFDLLPMIQEALAIKREQQDSTLSIVASAWSAPPWMKDIEDYYVRPTEANGFQGTGGMLKPQYEATYADYLLRYLDSYREQGVEIWGMTPVNEPNGNSGQWESMHFTPQSQGEFIKEHLGPKLHAGGYEGLKLLIYDQNRDDLPRWTAAILGDPEAARYVYGTGVHWYGSTTDVFEEALVEAHEQYSDFDIIHTEGTIDDLGKPAPGGIGDPEGFQESGWFANDDFWWNPNATDWAYTASWAPAPELHPVYTPVHRYARNIIVSFNNWMSGWIDWNIVLDSKGGPNHVGNFCGAPIMIDTESGEVYYTPIFHVLKQLSRTIRPGDRALQTTTVLADGMGEDALHASATRNAEGLISVQLLNTTKAPIDYTLQVGEEHAAIMIPANALQTVRLRPSARR